MIKAIQTRYKGYHFRSRLEARWAVYFDGIKAKWQYEPEGYELPSGKYLPDFFVQIADWDPISKEFPGCGYWVEIKGKTPTEIELRLLLECCKVTGHSGVLLVGDPLEYVSWNLHRNAIDIPKTSRKSYGPFCISANGLDGQDAWDGGHRAAIAARSARFEHGATAGVI